MPKFACAACSAARILCANCALAAKSPFDGLPSWPDAVHAMLPGARRMMAGDDDEDDAEDEEDEKPSGKKGKGDDDDRPRKKRKGDSGGGDVAKAAGMSIGMILLIVGGVAAFCLCVPGAILVALVVLAGPKVREAAARTQSTNNLKQIGLAFHSFHDANKRMPFNGSDIPVKGVKYSKKANAHEFTSGSWAFQILPYLDQAPLFNSAEAPHSGLAAYMCPGRGRPTHDDKGVPWTDYFINGYVNNPDQASQPDAADMKSTLVGITDGTSNTIIVGHGNIATVDYIKLANVTGSSNIFMGGSIGTLRAGNDGKTNPTGVTLSKDSPTPPNIGSWGGPFPQGALMAMCDGTVRMFPYNTANFSAFLTPTGGEIVTLPDT